MALPFIGRLNPTEYVALIGSFLFVAFEAVIRVLTLALPTSLVELFTEASQRIFNSITSPAQKRAEERKHVISSSIRNASDFVAICATNGYTAEEHVVQTRDGYLLGLHRLAWRKGEEETKVNDGPASVNKRVVYLHHGLLMNSEVWVCQTDAQRSLPFVLVEQGFDVWLGNNRGNKYSKKSIKHAPSSTKFWNFSIDEFAFFDIPDSIQYILDATQQRSLSYIGFSQGTTQAFASLSVNPKLNDQVNVFIALAPAMTVPGLKNGIVDALIKASPQVLFLLFGRRSILSSATTWQSILHPPIFIKLIDMGNNFLFGWKSKNMSLSQKLAAYPHLYSFTSTKSVVHWFQIIRNKSFQMFDDDVQTYFGMNTLNKYTKVARYPTRNIRTPVVIVYGGSDSLVDIRVMLKELPKRTVATEIPHYEHLDFLWARDADSQVFPHVFDALDNFTSAENPLREYESYARARDRSLSASTAFKHVRVNSDAMESDSASIPSNGQEDGDRPGPQHKAAEAPLVTLALPAELTPQQPLPTHPSTHIIALINENAASTPDRRSSVTLDGAPEVPAKETPAKETLLEEESAQEAPVQDTAAEETQTPALPPPPTTPSPPVRKLPRRRDSGLSINSPKDGGRGFIKIGTSQPASGIVTTASTDEGQHYPKKER
ncbi:Alpha/Beta hydrolase protein [Xylaria cf. heliscus]|nr:Alpha/Beta hydrolase protein [Xylaria cf. heliscus]